MAIQYREVKRKANVGERIKIVNAGYAGNPPVYANGDVVEVVKDCGAWGVRINRKWDNYSGINALVSHFEYVVLESIPAPTAQLNFPEVLAQFMRENAAAIRKYLDEVAPESAPAFSVEQSGTVSARNTTVTKSLTRAEVIAKAKADVAELERIGRDDDGFLPESSSDFYGRWFEVDFVVNRNKHAVTALVYEINGLARTFARINRKPDAKGIAKTAPGDVFNADIGKAIAVRRALGLTVPDEYVNAPLPDEPRVGAVVRGKESGKCGTVYWFVPRDKYPYQGRTADGKYFYTTKEFVNVTDDSDVDYSAATERSAA